MTETYTITQDGKTMSVTVTIPDADISLYTDYQWDSSLGIVTAVKGGKRVIVPHTGSNQSGTLDPDPEKTVTHSNNIVSIQLPRLYY